ncbi:ArsR/SmtB family transcription factor [Oceanirhabdus seepicola]|uniref:Winged helix-turn-helix transcriptional regulator n=1 Tax=Oceanirhabdus seepicola TaxID=2828781 RepID=A0A9J6P3T4_9CLOT|nr:winged helix-turn-helix domain-containing protein [Oceanirhabdus seepicola]MCM1991219.1 winged helix-turn-helix transcriptional regulator [Oceanirhabdus seepicola]
MENNLPIIYKTYTECRTSLMVEIIGVINAIISEKNKMYDHECIQKFKELLDEDDMKIIEVLNVSQLQGRSLIEFLFINEHYDNPELYCEHIKSLNEEDFIYLFHSEMITEQEIKGIKNHKLDLQEYLKTHKWIDEKEFEFVNSLMFKTQWIREGCCRIIRKLNKVVEESMSQFISLYSSDLDDIDKKIKYNSPLNVSQEIMGKTFKRVYDFRKYILIPTYYMQNGPARYFSTSTQILVKPLDIFKEEFTGENLSKALKVLSDPTRIELIKIISNNSYYGKELADKLNVKTPTISHHLESLKSVGLLHEEKIKNIRYVSLNKQRYSEILKALNQFIEK